MRIALIDYGAGNLTSVRKAFAAVGAEIFVPGTPGEIAGAEGVVVPGVGNFGATAVLDSGWRDALLAHVAVDRPLLGICLGMQWLYEGSEEAPAVPGLALLPGHCTRIGREATAPLKVPHVGWNTLDATRNSTMMASTAAEPYAYFTHSYGAPVTSDTVATTTYGGTFASVCERGRVFGVQFHPEKSGETGLGMLRAFVALGAAS